MATIDDSLNERPARRAGRWQHPRLLAFLAVLAFGSCVNAVVNGGLFGPDPWKGIDFFNESAVSGQFSGVGVNGQDWDQAKTCGRMYQIVETACSLGQRDHDAESIRQCIAHELKYTMWSAYDCR